MSDVRMSITGRLSIACRRFSSFCCVRHTIARFRGVLDFSPHLAEPPLRAGADHLVAAMTLEAARSVKRGASEMKGELVRTRFRVLGRA
jgi:hypothetical protein